MKIDRKKIETPEMDIHSNQNENEHVVKSPVTSTKQQTDGETVIDKVSCDTYSGRENDLSPSSGLSRKELLMKWQMQRKAQGHTPDMTKQVKAVPKPKHNQSKQFFAKFSNQLKDEYSSSKMSSENKLKKLPLVSRSTPSQRSPLSSPSDAAIASEGRPKVNSFNTSNFYADKLEKPFNGIQERPLIKRCGQDTKCENIKVSKQDRHVRSRISSSPTKSDTSEEAHLKTLEKEERLISLCKDLEASKLETDSGLEDATMTVKPALRQKRKSSAQVTADQVKMSKEILYRVVKEEGQRQRRANIKIVAAVLTLLTVMGMCGYAVYTISSVYQDAIQLQERAQTSGLLIVEQAKKNASNIIDNARRDAGSIIQAAIAQQKVSALEHNNLQETYQKIDEKRRYMKKWATQLELLHENLRAKEKQLEQERQTIQYNHTQAENKLKLAVSAEKRLAIASKIAEENAYQAGIQRAREEGKKIKEAARLEAQHMIEVAKKEIADMMINRNTVQDATPDIDELPNSNNSHEVIDAISAGNIVQDQPDGKDSVDEATQLSPTPVPFTPIQQTSWFSWSIIAVLTTVGGGLLLAFHLSTTTNRGNWDVIAAPPASTSSRDVRSRNPGWLQPLDVRGANKESDESSHSDEDSSEKPVAPKRTPPIKPQDTPLRRSLRLSAAKTSRTRQSYW